ncbi:ER membrane protein complex subunit 4 [Yarrowia sp. C11]|nr:ER membrane protein complex subunit 4 [Yarrowia sp. E02]KAG5367384.1 ER membrane protein complex subunit 4 [Yarrowia sp. C11]
MLPQWYDTLTTKPVKTLNIANPLTPPSFGKSGKKIVGKQASEHEQDVLKVKKAWDIALAPGKSLPMNLFMSYMSGSSLQIIPITMTAMMFFMTPLKSLVTCHKQFASLISPTNKSQILLCEVVYVLILIATMGAGVWKLGQMGLLPNTRSDWLAWETPSAYLEVINR